MSDPSVFTHPDKPSKEEIRIRLRGERDKLSAKQMTIKERKLPVLILIEGWGTSGKGTLISNIIKNLDPRFFRVCNIGKRTAEEERYPFIKKYFDLIPEQGNIRIFDGGYMGEATRLFLAEEISLSEYEQKIKDINIFERQLTEDGYVLVKFFIDIPKKEQKDRIGKLLSDKNTKWRISSHDIDQNRRYREYRNAYKAFMDETSKAFAPWYVIDGKSSSWAALQALEVINEALDTAFSNPDINYPVMQNIYPAVKCPKLSEIELDGKVISDEEYETRLDSLQNRLHDLHYELYRKKIPVIIAYEGWDAAGKGGNIKRVAAALDPRGCEVHPIASPEPHEKARHFLWRFWTRLPKDGHIAIFDRTWYGRVMVERIEGFCSENDWKRAYNEINEFEKSLTDWGAVIIKFWVHIDKDTQLIRFNDRQNNPEKQWKITDEDWRNREKWDIYESSVDEMIRKTSTVFAPWHILESNDKRYARIKALQIIIESIERKLK